MFLSSTVHPRLPNLDYLDPFFWEVNNNTNNAKKWEKKKTYPEKEIYNKNKSTMRKLEGQKM